MKLSLIVPVYNEQETINIFLRNINKNFFLKDCNLEIIFINDGSSDETGLIIDEIEKNSSNIKSLHFTRNFGKEAALIAGLRYSTGDVVIPIDVDLQDPIELIPRMISEWENGAEIVLAQRADRYNDSFLKRRSADFFYKFHNLISSPKIEENVGDFRLLSRPIVD